MRDWYFQRGQKRGGGGGYGGGGVEDDGGEDERESVVEGVMYQLINHRYGS